MNTKPVQRGLLSLGVLLIALFFIACSNASPKSDPVTSPGKVVAPGCIADLSHWKTPFKPNTLNCTQCHTTATSPRHGTVGGPWKVTTCLNCHDDVHE
jgi:hypothetical protein